MNKSASEMKLPDGRDIFYLNTEEVEYLYAQMPNYLTLEKLARSVQKHKYWYVFTYVQQTMQ